MSSLIVKSISRVIPMFMVVMLSACTMSVGTSVAPAQPTQANVPPVAVSYPPMPANLTEASVVKIVDGDTVDVLLNGQIERLRLIGVDTAETVDPRKPVECFGREASARATQLLTGQNVLLEADSSQSERDKYGRLLRYIWLPDGRLFNLQMIAEGYAYEYTYDLPYKYQAIFKSAQQNADSQQLGLWSPQTCSGQH